MIVTVRKRGTELQGLDDMIVRPDIGKHCTLMGFVDWIFPRADHIFKMLSLARCWAVVYDDRENEGVYFQPGLRLSEEVCR